MRGYFVAFLFVIAVLVLDGAESKGLNLQSGQTKITDFFSGLFGSNGNGGPFGGNAGPGQNGGGPSGSNAGPGQNGGGPSGSNAGPGQNGGGPSGSNAGPGQNGGGPSGSNAGPGQNGGGPSGSNAGPGQNGGGPSGSNAGPGQNGGGPSGSNSGPGPNGGGPSGGNTGPGSNGGGPSGGNGGPINLEEQLKLMKMLNLGKPDEPAQEGPGKEVLQTILRMSVVPPWVSLFEAEMQSMPEFRFPPYVLELNDSNGINGSVRTIMNKIDFPAVLPVLRTVLQQALQTGIPLPRIMRTVAPRLYNIKAGCPVNVLQKVLSKCAKNWADDRMMVIAAQLSQYTDEDIRPLTEAIKQEVLSEVNRAIFGTEFQEFDELLRFMQMSINWNLKLKNNTTGPGPNNDTDPLDMVLGLTQYVIQCKDRQSFLQEMLARVQVLKRRIIYANPFPFTARILRKLPFQCAHPSDRPGPEMLRDIYDGTAFVLNAVQKSLARLIDYVEQSLFFGDPRGLMTLLPENVFPELMESLTKLRNADGVPPVVPMPPPLPTPGNYTDMDMSPLPPMKNTNDTFWSPPPGNFTLPPTYSNYTTMPSANYTMPSGNVTANTTPQPGSPTTTNPPPNAQARRSQNYSKVKLLKLLLRGLVAAKRDETK